MSEKKEITTKSGAVISESWCRKCAKMRPASEFYEAVDNGLVDTLMIMSVCKPCINTLYANAYDETGSMEKALHKLCILLNVRYDNSAVDAVRQNVQTLIDNGKNVNSIFGIYRSKIISISKSMKKDLIEYNGYEDVSTIFTEKQIEKEEIPLPKDVIDFWGHDVSRGDIEFLEREYANFKNTHSADTYAEIVLLKQVCFTMLSIKKLRANGDDTTDALKELQSLMKNLAISPNAVKSSATSGPDTFGIWIAEIEKEEPAQWLKHDPRAQMFRDVSDVEGYFQKYIVRPIKNFITQSKDFNIDESDIEDAFEDPSDFSNIDDGELVEE